MLLINFHGVTMYLPKITYEALPAIYIAIGLSFILGASYIGIGNGIMLGYLIIGLTCVFAGVVVAAMRAHHRTQSESRQPRT